MTPEEDLERITQEVYEHLRGKNAPPTARNIVHAMFDIHYADWLGHGSIYPECEYEHQQ